MLTAQWAGSSVGERLLDTQKVGSSILLPPTSKIKPSGSPEPLLQKAFTAILLQPTKKYPAIRREGYMLLLPGLNREFFFSFCFSC
jgi:hypothetical protein